MNGILKRVPPKLNLGHCQSNHTAYWLDRLRSLLGLEGLPKMAKRSSTLRDTAPIVRIGEHAAAIGEIVEELDQEMLKTLVRALLLEVGRETARHITKGQSDTSQEG